MPQRSILSRLELLEEAARAQALGDCICFPEKEQPVFHWPIEQEIAAKVKCPIHGERFKSVYMVYVAKWRRDKRELLKARSSPQYRKAWDASFPSELWPAEEVGEGYKLCLKLKDGTRILLYGPRAGEPK